MKFDACCSTSSCNASCISSNLQMYNTTDQSIIHYSLGQMVSDMKLNLWTNQNHIENFPIFYNTTVVNVILHTAAAATSNFNNRKTNMKETR